MFERLGQDLRYAARSLRRAPGFAIVAVLTLVITIGANTAVFSVVDAVLLRPLSYRDPDRLVVIHDTVPRLGRAPTSSREFNEWRRSARTFDTMALLAIAPTILTGTGDPERLDAARVSASLFPMLGVSPALGRTFSADEETAGRDHVVVLSDALWQRRFGRDPGVIGRAITLNDQPFTVIGVLPASFRFPRLEQLYSMPIAGGRPELWVPFVSPPPNRDENSFACIARLKSGASLEQARADLNGIQGAIGRRFTPPIPLGADIVPLQDQITDRSRDNLLFLWAGVVLVLLIACANLANLFLARAWSRRREFAVRAAIGASRARVVSQMLVESLVVCVVGGAGGAALAYAAVPLFVATSPVTLPRLEYVAVTPRALAFGAAIAVLCAIVVGTLPALHTAGAHVVDTLRGRGAAGGQSARDRHARRLLVAAQVALTVVCLVASGLLLRSFYNVLVDRGFAVEHVLGLRVGLPPARYPTREAKAAFVRSALDRLQALPGVTAAGVVNRLPLNGVAMNTLVAAAGTEGAPIPASERPLGDIRSVNAGYFRTLAIALQRGRVFQDTDVSRNVAVVSRATAARLWPREDPIGKQFRLAMDPTRLVDVVGVVADVRAMALDAQPPLSIYLPYWQGFLNDVSFAVRTPGDELALAAPARDIIRSLDPQAPVDAVRPMTDVLSDAVAPRRFEAAVLVVFGVVAMLLAGLGVYGVLAQMVIQRTRELGVRLALGAKPSAVRGMVLRDAVRLVAWGLIVGIPASIGAGVMLRGLLFGIEPQNPVVLLGACGTIVVVALLGAHLPARRAAAVDPMISLRAE